MLTQLSTVKARLALTVTDYDGILTNAIKAVSDRFDKETNRMLARTTTGTHEFDASDTEILPPCYPIESVTKFETKPDEATGCRANRREVSPPPRLRHLLVFPAINHHLS